MVEQRQPAPPPDDEGWRRQLVFELSEDDVRRLPHRDALRSALAWARRGGLGGVDWSSEEGTIDRNKASFALQRWMEETREQQHEGGGARWTASDIREAVSAVRPLDWCVRNGIRPTYVPWDSEAQRRELEGLLATDRRASLIRRATRLGHLEEDLSLREHLDDAASVAGRLGVALKFIEDDGYLFTIGNAYWTGDGGAELFFLLDAWTDPLPLADRVNAWASRSAGERTVDAVLGKTFQAVLGAADGEDDVGIAIPAVVSSDRHFRLMRPVEKACTMGYSIWFYVNFADACIDGVPYCVLDLRRIAASPDDTVGPAPR